MIIFQVGKDAAKSFSVYEGVVKDRSDFVRDATNKEREEGEVAESQVIRLADVDPKVFSL